MTQNRIFHKPWLGKLGAWLVLVALCGVATNYVISNSSAANNAASKQATKSTSPQLAQQNNATSLGGNIIQLDNVDPEVASGQFNISSLITNNNNLYVQISRDNKFKMTDKYVHPNCQTLIDSYKESFSYFKGEDTRLSNKVLSLITGEMQTQFKNLSSLPLGEQEYTCFLYNLFNYAEAGKDNVNVTLSDAAPEAPTDAPVDDTVPNQTEQQAKPDAGK